MRYRSLGLTAAIALLISGLLCLPGVANALVVPLSTKQLCDYSQTIVVATVDSTEATWTSVPGTPALAKATIMTEVQLRVLEVLKGQPVSDLTIQAPGGRVGDTEMVFEDAPVFRAGGSYLVFLDASRQVVGWREGGLEVSDGRVTDLDLTLTAAEHRVAEVTHAPSAVIRARALSALRTLEPRGGTDEMSSRDLRTQSLRRPKTPQPLITKVTPGKAPAGTDSSLSKVTILGSGFGASQTAKARVRFAGSARNAAVSSWSEKKIVCRVPYDAHSGDAIVRNMWGKASDGWSFVVTFGYGGIRWAGNSCTYRINTNGKDPVAAREMFAAAAATWNAAGADFSFAPEGDGTCSTATYWADGHNDAFWSFSIPPNIIATTLAVNTRDFPDGRTIVEFDIWFNDNFPWGNGSPMTYDVQSIALHELGHALALDDLYGAADRGKVMFGKSDPGVQARVLRPEDKDGIEWIYGKKSTPIPDGIAYGFDGEIWTVAPDGSGKRCLTKTIGTRYYDIEPAWSPDRTRLAYKHGDGGRNGVGPDGINYVLRVVNADGSGDRRLDYAGPSVASMGADIAWSPDGNFIAGGYRPSKTVRECAVTILDLRTMTSREVATFPEWSVGQLDWSPDSQRLVVVASDGAVLLDVASGAIVRRFEFEPGAWVSSVCWRPDGQHLMFGLVKYVDDDTASWTEIRTPDGVLVGTLPRNTYPPSYSPDSSQFAYCAHDGGDGDDDVLWRVNVDGSGATEVLRTRPDPIYRLGFEGVAWK